MIKLKLIKPTLEYKEQVLETVQEFFDNDSNLYGVSGLKRYLDDYEGWLELVDDIEKGKTVDKKYVPGKQFLLVRESDDRLIGFISIRLKLNDALLEHGGHIGYSIRPSERKRGYATVQLFSVLPIYADMGVDEILLVCDKANIGSAKTIQKCGGILENEIIDSSDGELIQRYWIDVRQGIKKRGKFLEDNGFNIEII